MKPELFEKGANSLQQIGLAVPFLLADFATQLAVFRTIRATLTMVNNVMPNKSYSLGAT
jgi:hypothetical protein